jgi:hypothetical protein
VRAITTRLNFNRVSVHVKDTRHYYKMEAHFDKTNTYQLRKKLNEVLGRNDLHRNKEVDTRIMLHDNARFSLYSIPGVIRIRFNKRENTQASYQEIKAIGENIKTAIVNTRQSF